MKQVFIFVLLLVPAWACNNATQHRCYYEDELSAAAERRLRRGHRQTTEPAVAGTPVADSPCPVNLYQGLQAVSLEDRSLSPWRYVHVTKDDRFPSTYVEAQCLCNGCILIQDKPHKSPEVVESHDYNSVPIEQTRMFLKRELCKDEQGQKKKYRLTPVYEKVVVGCTCARVKTVS